MLETTSSQSTLNETHETQKPKRNRIKYTGLWQKKTKDGETFLVGKIGQNELVIYRNKEKLNDKSPDYISFLQEIDRSYLKNRKDSSLEDASSDSE